MDAINVLLGVVAATVGERRDTMRWLRSTRGAGEISFDTVCFWLRLDPTFSRQAIEVAIAHRPVRVEHRGRRRRWERGYVQPAAAAPDGDQAATSPTPLSVASSETLVRVGQAETDDR